MQNLLVTVDNLHQFIHPSRPLHKAYEYLTPVHKSDYLRPYFGYFYGGGYMDIKPCLGSWERGWNDLMQNRNPLIFMNSYANPDKGCVPEQLGEEIQNAYASLPYVSIYLTRKHNPVMLQWLDEADKILDEKFEILKTNPAQSLFDKKEDGNGYPIEWNEIGARILHRVFYQSNQKCLFTLPFIQRNHHLYR